MAELDITPGEPFKLPDGTLVYPHDNPGEKVVTPQEVEMNKELEDVFSAVDDGNFTASYVRSLADITLEPKQMTTVITILAYTMWGLPSHAVARVLGTTIENIDHIKSTDGYTRVQQELLEGIRYSEQATVHGYLTQKARSAATVMAANLKNRSPDVSMAAAKDILDRTGFRPADKIEHHHKFEDELRIVHVVDEPMKTIDVEVNIED
jgi:hypothetical protein